MSFVRVVELVPERTGDAATYPWSLPVVRGLGRLELDPAVTVLVGENGTGKSTLVEALAEAGLAPVAFDDIDHVRLTRAFLDDPQRFLHHVLDDEPTRGRAARR